MTEDYYKLLRQAGQQLCEKLIGKTSDEAQVICDGAGFWFRYLSIDGKGCMITADCRMDRIGCHVSQGKVITASVG